MSRKPVDPGPDRWETIEALCFEAMQLMGEERQRLLDERCADDPELRGEVETLLTAYDEHPDFLEAPAISVPGGLGPAEDALADDVRVGPYRLVRPLGHGGMGDVYLATREGDGFTQTVALKLIRRGLDTQRVLDRFRLERRILAGLRHPHIAQLLDGSATSDGRPYFVMEYVEGEAVDAYCDRLGLSVRARLQMVETICGAVHHAHQNLVVHRDIKPSNILVTPEGVPKLLDFGIGKVLSEDDGVDSDVTRVEDRALTPDYAAPELLRGEPVTTATDVYGLGVLLYRLLTGRLPYPESQTRSQMLRARDRSPVRPSSAASPGRRVSSELDAIVLKALALDVEERYSSATALAEDLRRYLSGRPVRARAPGPLYLARKFVGRHRWGVGMGAAAVIALLAGTVYTLEQSRRVARERDKALAVRGFLLESFGAAGADQAVGDSVTARALLDGQAATVEEAYADDPEFRREMMTVLAEGYERLGLFGEAEAWAGRVVEEARADGDPALASALGLLGWIRHQQGRPMDAEGMLEEAVLLARSAPRSERTLARTLNDLGVVQEALGKYDEAGSSHQEALDLRAELFGENDRSVAVSASNLSVIRYRQGDFQGAVEQAALALEVVETAFGPDHQRAIIVQSNLAVFRMVAGDLAGAETEFRDLADRQARTQGPEHPVRVRVLNSLAAVLRQQEKWAEAEEVLQDVLGIMEGWDEPNPVELGDVLGSLGDAQSAQGRFEEARQHLDRALALQLETLGPDHVELADTQLFMAVLFERWGDLDLAVDWQTRGTDTYGRALGPFHEATLNHRLRLGRLFLKAGRVEEGRDLLRRVRDATLSNFGDSHPLVAESTTLLGAVG